MIENEQPADNELARDTQAGSLAAFDRLVRRHETRIFNYLRRRTGRTEDARDLTQQTFVQAYRKIGRYDTRRSFAAWLYTIARRFSIDHYRAQVPTVAIENIEPAADESDPATECAGNDDQDQFWAVVRKIVTEAEFTALWLMYQEGMSVREIAQSMRRSLSATKVILFRARKRLAAGLPVHYREKIGASAEANKAAAKNNSTKEGSRCYV